MTFSGFMLFLLTILVPAAFLVNGYLNRKHEIYKKRLELRLIMLEKFILFYAKAQEYHTLDGFHQIQLLINLYGEEDEIKRMDYIATLIKNSPKNVELPKRLHELHNIVKEKLRTELEIF